VIPRTCLCLIRRESAAGPQVLLGHKKTGFGAGKWVGIGGHVEPGEKPVEAAVREVAEETGLLVPADSLQHMASIEFRFPARPAWDQATDVFVTSVYQGEPTESSEVAPRWFATDALPGCGMTPGTGCRGCSRVSTWTCSSRSRTTARRSPGWNPT
jgi:8-oxo-dGTP diphosphatase